MALIVKTLKVLLSNFDV